MQNHGAFRTVRAWSLSSIDNDHLQLTRRRQGSRKSHYQHSYRELIPSNRRALIILVSDCVSSIWQQGKIYQWLQEWSNKVPTAIMQLFPERLWQSSELGLGDKLLFSAFKPGVPNSDLVLPSLWEELKGKQALKLPVVTLEELSLENWAKVVAGRGNTHTPGFAFDLEFVAEQAKKSATVNPQELSSENLVDRFLATASPTAQRLAGLMAAAPVDLRVVHLIQKNLLPQPATPVPIAEVFLSGMLRRVNASEKGKNPQYDFVPKVRKILNRAMRLDETENVLDVISSYIADNLGLSIKSFTALLLRLPDLSNEQQEQILPFARVAIEVLQNLGGEYANFAQEVAGTFPSSLQVFEFKTPTVNRRGEIIKQDTKLAQYFSENLGNNVTLEMVAIPGGKFLMGSPEDEAERYDDESPQHEVTVPPFFMGKYPVTQAQWRTVAALPQVNRELDPDPSHFKGDNLPVETISWYEAVEFCDRISKHTEQNYRLPSEAEWEYACRAGTTTPFNFGETITADLASYNAELTYADEPKGKSANQTTPVGNFVLNSFGLYDMHGNVWEWCADHWYDKYEGAPIDGSAWIKPQKENDNDNQKRLLRGGSWYYGPWDCRSASRIHFDPDFRYYAFGFRVVVSRART